MKPINKLKLEFPAQSVNESFARATVAAFAAAVNPTIDEVNDIKTAVSEAVTNSVVHGYDLAAGQTAGEGQTISIECQLFSDYIDITVSDNGRGIKDIKTAMQPFATTKPSQDRSGMGFTVMQSFMDNIDVANSDHGGAVITMRKFFQGTRTAGLRNTSMQSAR